MSKNLVIVESPAKSKTIQKYLGQEFEILASYGHVRDLVAKEGSVDPDNNFKLKYKIIDKNKKHVDAIKQAVKNAENVYLAPDPDREGEAIAWHINEILKNARILKNQNIKRITFHEITYKAVKNAIANPEDISMNLVYAQQARVALDYLVGYTLSPILWKKIRYGLSAGRVQSPALRLIVEREKAIEDFKVQEYWDISADLEAQNHAFKAYLYHYQDQKIDKFEFQNQKEVEAAIEQVRCDANGYLIVNEVTRKQRRKNPQPPFITSTLQQDAARKLNFTAKKTMMVAQQLYEGITLGQQGAVGLITYMRTDSINLSQEALDDIRNYITAHFTANKLPASPRQFKTKSKNAQEAHEAIRPTSAFKNPESIQQFLSSDQYKLYDLIWKRAIASQMMHATLNIMTIDLKSAEGANYFRATGSIITKPGFLSIYQEAEEQQTEQNTDNPQEKLPPLEKGQKITIKAINPHQHFTEPPRRYSEALLVKTLEEMGIGRPSTYATIISTLQTRNYVQLINKRFHPTDVGRIVNQFLTTYFTKYVDYGFTSQLENQLDQIAKGKIDWLKVMESFWHPFYQLAQKIEANVKKQDVTSETLDEKCPQCHHNLNIKLGKRGRFIACTNYPDCKYTRPLKQNNETASTPEVVQAYNCPKCGHKLHVKEGRYGKFIGCSNYPQCKHMEPLEKPKDTGIQCPKCQTNQIVQKKSRKGKHFYACNGFPKCKYALWHPPINEPCPKCHWPILMNKFTKKAGKQKACPQTSCDYAVSIEEQNIEKSPG